MLKNKFSSQAFALLASSCIIPLSFPLLAQGQETTISVGLGSESGFTGIDGPQRRTQANANSAVKYEYMSDPSILFSVALQSHNNGVNEEYYFSYLSGKSTLKASSFPDYPRSYIEPASPFSYNIQNDFYTNVRSAERTETGVYFEYRGYYSTELASRSGASLSAFGGLGFSANYFTASTLYKTAAGSTYAETKQTEYAVRATPLLGTSLKYSFKGGQYLRTNINVSTGEIGYVSIDNEVVSGTNIAETRFNSAGSSHRKVDTGSTNGNIQSNLSASNTLAAVTYGMDALEFTVGGRNFRAAGDTRTYTYFEVGFKF